jgi:hypothetical protein
MSGPVKMEAGSVKPVKKEFIALDALRWETREMDVTALETEDDLAAAWRDVKEAVRESAGRPALLRLRLTGEMKNRSLFYGASIVREDGVLMKKLNLDEGARKNFVLVDSLEDETLAPSREPAAEGLEADFWKETSFFKSGIDLRVGLFDALRERGFLKRLLATDAAPLLENMTEADVEPILLEAIHMARQGFSLFGDSLEGSGRGAE